MFNGQIFPCDGKLKSHGVRINWIRLLVHYFFGFTPAFHTVPGGWGYG